MATRRVRIGLAGLGRMGRIHANNLASRCSAAQLAAVFDMNADAAREVGERLDAAWVKSYDDVLADDTIDAVAIATPTGTHAELSVRAARAGKHVFCEKPISLDRQTSVETITAVQDGAAHGTAVSDPAFRRDRHIDTAVVVLRFENDALGVIDNSRSAGYGYECSTEVIGSLATVRVDNPGGRNYEWRTPGWASHELARDFEQRYPWAYSEELDAFARCVRDDAPPRVTGWDALAAFDLALAADRTWRERRPVAVLPTRTEDGVVYEVATG